MPGGLRIPSMGRCLAIARLCRQIGLNGGRNIRAALTGCRLLRRHTNMTGCCVRIFVCVALRVVVRRLVAVHVPRIRFAARRISGMRKARLGAMSLVLRRQLLVRTHGIARRGFVPTRQLLGRLAMRRRPPRGALRRTVGPRHILEIPLSLLRLSSNQESSALNRGPAPREPRDRKISPASSRRSAPVVQRSQASHLAE